MKVLVVGSGGREHTLAWALGGSPAVEKVYAAPGSAGMGPDVERVPIGADDSDALAQFAESKAVDLTVVGPEQPLAAGLVNRFQAKGLCVFGPTREAAQLESSKSFAKAFMERHRIPTPPARVCVGMDEAMGALDAFVYPVVIKADGLAAGKGVVIADSRKEAEGALHGMLVEKRHGSAADRVLLETFIDGEEASFIAICDGRRWKALPTSQDHKRAFDGDTGPNTGGMGAVSPAAVLDDSIVRTVAERIIGPAVSGMAEQGIPFTGFLYAGLILSEGEPYVLEFNTRLGDPETQAILPRLRLDLAQVLHAAARGELSDSPETEVTGDVSACVVLASKGYPGPYEKGKVIAGIEEASQQEGIRIFHAGTERSGHRWVTNGGRVLGVTATAETLRGALDRVYRAVDRISFEGMHFRSDIGRRALMRETGRR